MVASECGDRIYLLDLLKEPVLAAQEFFLLAGRALKNIFRRPHYGDDIALQMDAIGVGSLPVVVMIGCFSGVVMALQMSRALSQYGQVGKTGTLVSLTLVRELGPVLTAIMVAGRNSTGMASELGSMKVTEQIDAMRALGTDPVQKLVTPRLIATCVMLPLLTIIADFVGMIGGFIIAKFRSERHARAGHGPGPETGDAAAHRHLCDAPAFDDHRRFRGYDRRLHHRQVRPQHRKPAILDIRMARAGVERRDARAAQTIGRSEEHTSE